MAVALREGKTFRNVEGLVERPDGSRFVASVNIDPVRDENGDVCGAINVFQDISDRKQTTEALRQSEERFRLATRAGTVGVWDWDVTTNKVSWSDSVFAIHGLKPNEFAGTVEAFGALVHPDDQARIQEALQRALRDGAPYEVEFRSTRPDGKVIWIYTTAQIIRDASGAPLRMLGSTVDITRRKEVEAALRESEQRHRQLLSLMPSAVYTCDRDGRITFYNRRAAELWGREPGLNDDDQKFCGALKLWLPDGAELPHAQTPMAVAVRDGVPCRDREVVIERLDGSRVTVNVNIDPLFDDEGRPCGAINVFQDITARVRAEETLHRHQAQLEAELADTQRLQEISATLIQEDNAELLYGKILEAAISMLGADMGCMQMADEQEDALRILACRGLSPDFSKAFDFCRPDARTCCNLARENGERVIVPDVEASGFFAGTEALAEFQKMGVRAVQSTPLVSRNGRLVGMISTHWRRTHQPTERDLRLLDIVARQAADAIERRHAEMLLGKSKSLLEGQKDAFQAAMKGCSLEESLHVLVRLAIGFTGGRARAAFFLTRPDGNTLRHVVGMTKEYAFDVDGFLIGADSLACGLAMHLRQPIITPDVETEPRWEPWRWMARKHDYRACWSFPVHTNDGPVFGTFAMYFREP
jgi:PAS domain S-box-containing protein